MSKRRVPDFLKNRPTHQPVKIVKSLLDTMVDGNEYSSIIDCTPNDLDLRDEIVKAIREISKIRNRPVVCYLANVVNSSIKSYTGIDTTDDLPFSEMIDSINKNEKNVDIILVTPGGSAEQVSKFVDKLRIRFENVGFILPYMAMSAGTIFCLSADDLIMSSRAYIGPIDPQVPTKEGRYVPAQAILTLINDIQHRGKALLDQGISPLWTDIQILNNLDAKEVGNAISASRFSIDLVTEYLANYKFKTWIHHSSNNQPVTDDDRKRRANEIATQLCDHSLWKTHSRGITREMAQKICRLQIIHPENISDLDRAIRRFWALVYWVFERTNIVKLIISENYAIFRGENPST